MAGRKKVDKQFWNEEKVGAAMRLYKSSFTVENVRRGKGQTNQVTISLIDPKQKYSLEKLYSEVIYPAHSDLARAYCYYRKVDAAHTMEMIEDIASYLYEVMMKYWDHTKDTSSYSYFAYACSTMIAHYFGGKLACSPLWTKEKEANLPLSSVNVKDYDNKEDAEQELVRQMEALDISTSSYEIKSAKKRKIAVSTSTKTRTEFIEEGSDIVDLEVSSFWNQIDLKTLSEYIPDVVIAKKYHDLAYTLLEVVDEILNKKISKSPSQRMDFWILKAVKERSDWKVTLPDVKMGFFVLRNAMKWYLDDFPIEDEVEYGINGYIRSINDES